MLHFKQTTETVQVFPVFFKTALSQ